MLRAMRISWALGWRAWALSLAICLPLGAAVTWLLDASFGFMLMFIPVQMHLLTVTKADDDEADVDAMLLTAPVSHDEVVRSHYVVGVPMAVATAVGAYVLEGHFVRLMRSGALGPEAAGGTLELMLPFDAVSWLFAVMTLGLMACFVVALAVPAFIRAPRMAALAVPLLAGLFGGAGWVMCAVFAELAAEPGMVTPYVMVSYVAGSAFLAAVSLWASRAVSKRIYCRRSW